MSGAGGLYPGRELAVVRGRQLVDVRGRQRVVVSGRAAAGRWPGGGGVSGRVTSGHTGISSDQGRCGPMLAIDGCHVATGDAAGRGEPAGYVVISEDRMRAVGS